jgi:hypothetical protein
MLIKMKNKKAQIWIETVIYTGIALALIALVLNYINPKIEVARNRALVDQTISSLNKIDSKISEVLQAKGNRRIVEVNLKRGYLFFNPAGDEIYFLINELKEPYSQPDVAIPQGRMTVTTLKNGAYYDVKISIIYSEFDLSYDSQQAEKKFSPISGPYSFIVEYLNEEEKKIDVRETVPT